MAPPKRPWFRFYTEALTDPKLRRLTPAQRWLFVAVLGAARSSPLPGFLMLTEREPLTTADLADLAGVPEKATAEGLERMQQLGLVERDEALGAWCVPKWNARQFESDDTTKRTSKHRTKERSNNGDGTHQRQTTEPDAEADLTTSSDGSPPAVAPADDEWMAAAVSSWADAYTAHRAKTHKVDDPISYAAGCRKKPDPKVLIELQRLHLDETWLSPEHAGRVAMGERGLLNARPVEVPDVGPGPSLEEIRAHREEVRA